MKGRTKITAGVTVLALAAGGVGVASAIGTGDDSNETATGPGADRAKAAALAITHGGHANAVERDSENGATWEVEVTRPDGVTVDVRLDSAYNLVVTERDSEHGDRGQDNDDVQHEE